MRDAPGALLCRIKILKTSFFYLFTFLPLKSTAGNSERSSDGCKDGDCNLQNCFPSICFHNLYFNVDFFNVEC